LGPFGVDINTKDGGMIGTVFTYVRGFDTMLANLVDLGRETTLLVFGDKSQGGMSASLGRLGGNQVAEPVEATFLGTPPCIRYQYKNIRLVYMPFIDQHNYDTLLCCTDFNIVRGEDSLARAVLSGRPFIWNAYIQDENYQLVKVRAFLDTFRPYYSDNPEIFDEYSALMLEFNSASAESSNQATKERYGSFFKKLQKYEHFTNYIYYIIAGSCNLITKFCNFLDNYREDLNEGNSGNQGG
jgi:hypothetical protein